MKSTQLLALLFIALLSTVLVFTFSISLVSASSILPDANLEYASGALTPDNAPFKVWYNWVNFSGTQVIYYAAYTPPDYPYPVPIANIIGQHLKLADGKEVFIASALSELEVYRDLNGDGVPQATTIGSGENELLYYIYSNMSQGYSVTPVQKVIIDSLSHYQWSFTYQNAYAYLQDATVRVGVIARMFFEHLILSYDFSVNGNVTSLKTSFDIGKVANLEVLDPSKFSSFDGLSLALLYATATYTSTSYSTLVNGQPYDSSTSNSAVNASIAEIKVEDVKAYDFVFGGSYVVGDQSLGANVEAYEAKAQAVPRSGLPTIYSPTVRSISFFRDELNLNDLFGGSWPSINANYESSSLIYRICFPVWDGLQIMHDPTFIGYMSADTTIPEYSSVAVLFLSILLLSAVLIVKLKKRTIHQF